MTITVVDTESWVSYGPNPPGTLDPTKPAIRGWSVFGGPFYSHGPWSTGTTWAMTLSNAGSGQNAVKVFPSGGPTFSSVGFWIKTPAGDPGFDEAFTECFNATSTEHWYLIRRRDGSLALGRGGVTVATCTSVIGDGTWHHVEFTAMTDVGSGQIFGRVYLDGFLVLNWPGPFGVVRFSQSYLDSCGPTSDFTYVSDIFWGTGGDTGDTTGPSRVECLFPNADGAYQNFVPSAGSAHWSLVNERPEDGIGSYVESPTIGDKDTFPITSLVSTTGTVQAVNVVAVADRSLAGPRSLSVMVHNAGGDNTGTAAVLGGGSPTTFGATAVQSVLSNPYGSAWTISGGLTSGVNSVEIGVEVSA